MQVAGPRCGIADTPIDKIQCGIVIAGHPGRATAILPVVALPGLIAGFARAGDREGAPQLLAVIGVVGDDIAAYAIFAARPADDDLAVDDERHQGQVLPSLVIL